MKSCELCKSPARIYCESDQASLCWTCDSKVHSANFLVARHSRALLCRVCQSVTPWTASGRKLGPSAVSVCDMCVGDTASDDDEEEEDDGLQELINDDDDDDDESVDEDGENQVVPLLLCSTPPPPVASSSSSGSVCGGDDLCVSDTNFLVSVKRKRFNVVDISSSEDDIYSETKYLNENRKKAAKLYQFLPTSSEEMGEKLGRKKDHRTGKDIEDGEVGVCKGMTTVGLDLNAD